MTMEDVVNRVSYAGDGAQTVFSWAHPIQSSDQLKLYWVVTATKVGTLKTLNTHYTMVVASDFSGATITFGGSYIPPAGTDVVIYCDPAITQALELDQTSVFPSASLETALDKQALISKRLSEQAGRAIRLPSYSESTVDLTLPEDLSSCAGRALTFDSDGDGIAPVSEWPTTTDITSASTNATAAAASASAAATSATAAAASATSAAATFASATALNTASTVVKRDGSGNFAAGTITAALSGNATTATSATSATSVSTITTLGDTLYGGAAGATTRLAGNTTATKKFKTQTGDGSNSAAPAWSTIAVGDVPTLNQNTSGTSANVTGTVAIANGGTGQITKAPAFDALSPMTTSGDIIYGGASGTGTRLPKGSNGQFLTLTAGIPAWAAATVTAPTSVIWLSNNNGYGAVSTSVTRWTTIQVNSGGSDITYADSSNAGGSFTINTAGVYAVYFWLDINAAAANSLVYITKNGSVLGTQLFNPAQYYGYSAVTYPMAVNDVIRAVVGGTTTQSTGSATQQGFLIARCA